MGEAFADVYSVFLLCFVRQAEGDASLLFYLKKLGCSHVNSTARYADRKAGPV